MANPLDGLFGITDIAVAGAAVAFHQRVNLLGGWAWGEDVDDDGNARLTLTPPGGAAITAGNGLTGTSVIAVLAEDSTIVVGAGGIKRAAITGDVTVAAGSNVAAIGAGVIVNADINASASIALTKLAPVASAILLGRTTAGSGSIEALTLNATLGFSGSALQREALTGDVTAAAGSNTTAIAAGVIVDADVNSAAAIALTKLASVATATLLGRTTAGTGSLEQLTLNATLSFSGTTLQRAALTGDVTAAAGSNTTAIAAGVIVNADINAGAAIAFSKFASLAGLSLLGNDTNVSVTPVAITGTAGQVLVVSGTVLNFGQLDLSLSAAVTGTLSQTRGGTGFSGAGGTANRVFLTTDGTTAAWGQVNLASAQVTGVLPVANVAPSGTNGRVLVTIAGATTWSTTLGNATDATLLNGVDVQLQTAGTTVLHAVTLSARQILGLCGGVVTTTQMPANTGALVAYLGNASTEPTTGSPVSGNIIWSSNVSKADSARLKNPAGGFWALSPEGNWHRYFRRDSGTTNSTASTTIGTINLGGLGNGSGSVRVFLSSRDATNSFGQQVYGFNFSTQGGVLQSGSTTPTALYGSGIATAVALAYPGSPNVQFKVSAVDSVSYTHEVLFEITFHPNAA